MKIKKVLFAPGVSGAYYDDQVAVKSGLKPDGLFYKGNPAIRGFKRIRQPGESISVILILEDDQIAIGDCSAVQYSGIGGRDPIFLSSIYVPYLKNHIEPILQKLDIIRFKDTCRAIEQIEPKGKKIPNALRYGLSQAILDASAKIKRKTMAEIILDEYHLPLIPERIPIFGQTGDDRYSNVDKMILKEVDVLPHALINNVADKLGSKGQKLKAYIKWLVQRIKDFRTHPSYKPILHIDVYGTVGIIFNNDPVKVASYLAQLENICSEFPLYIEAPVDVGGKPQQIEALSAIRSEMKRIGCKIKIVADEWCNTLADVKSFVNSKCCHMIQIKTPDLGCVHNVVESILYCKENGVEAYQGGTCNETDISSRICTQIAVAARADRILAKPGLGFDEGYCIVKNEMERTLEILKYKKSLKNGKEAI